jgi:undecaprenyl-diphosphatase
MSIFRALILGTLQGLTEFIPVSSSGHLVIFPEVLGWESQPLVFDTTLHLATAFALILCFWKDITAIIKSLFKDFSKYKGDVKNYSSDSMMGLKIALGSVPVGIVGLLFEDVLENTFRGILSVAVFLLFGSFLMWFAEKRLEKRLLVKDDISLMKSIEIGFFQVLALLPGVSRSGSTISGGMIFGLSRKEATRFSFLLSIPVVFMAGMFKLLSSYEYINAPDVPAMFIGFISSFLVGILAIKFMLKFVKNNKLYPFIFYRIGLALFLIILSVI